MNPGIKKILTLLLFSIISVAIGILGFVVLEDYSLVEAFYMTVITLSTVGFETTKRLSSSGMIFVSVYIMLNIGLFAYIVSKVIRYVFEGELSGEYKKYKNQKVLKKMENHIIVCGFGRNGSKAFSELKESHESTVVIDNNESLRDELQNNGHIFINGDASDEEILLSAEISRAKAIIITLPNDADNVFITLSARELNSSIRIISRASNDSSLSKLVKAGANDVVMPDSLGGKHMAQLVTKPSIIQFLNMLEGVGSDFHMEEVSYGQLKKEFQGETIQDMNIRNISGLSVIAHKTMSGQFIVNPGAHSLLKEGDTFILLGRAEDVTLFVDHFVRQ